MWRYVIIAVGVAAIASEIPELIGVNQSQPEQQSNQSQSPSKTASTNENANSASSHNPLEGRTARIKMDSRGHFVTNARMNGRQIEVLVDTGATSVAINQSTARRLGIHLKQSDFRYKVNTANGAIKVALATIDEIRIGRCNGAECPGKRRERQVAQLDLAWHEFFERTQEIRD